MILPIRIWPDPVLLKQADPVTEFDEALAQLCADMLETMYAAPGRGLAAPQIGVSRRIFVMDATWKEGAFEPRIFINPVVTPVGESISIHDEGCLSLPGFTVEVKRPSAVSIRWQDLDGRTCNDSFDGFAAVCIQHEFDHLEGILTLHHISDEARAEILPLLQDLEQRA
jgi:peptide deformylase